MIGLRHRVQGGGIPGVRVTDDRVGERFAAGQKTGLAFLLEAVALALVVDDRRVMQEAVEDGGGDDPVAEHLAPDGEGLVRGDEDGALLVAAGDELEEQVGGQTVEGQVADLVDDEELGLDEELEPFLETALGVGPGEGGDESGGGGERGAVTESTRLEPDADGEVGLADARGTEEQDVVGVGDEPAGGQVLDHLGVDEGWNLKSKLSRLIW